MSKKPWFEVDREGLAEIVLRRGGLSWLIQELISNCWDENGVTKVDVTIEPVEGSPTVELTVIDDAPEGFKDLSHAWTLFAKSAKRTDAEKRGRFNLGEKLVLAFCKEAAITTTTGQVMFDSRGRTSGRERRSAGSEFFGIIRMTRAQLDQALVDLKRLIPPNNIATTINGERLMPRAPIASWHESLWTELPDEETGALARRLRYCEVRAFQPKKGETPMIYEMGIPVVAFDGDPLHVSVCVAPETKILTGDLRYVPAASVRVGETLLGFDEDRAERAGKNRDRRHYRPSIVKSASRLMRPCYRLTFDNGTNVVCSADHQWLTLWSKTPRWLRTDQMRATHGKQMGSFVVRPLDVWDEDTSYEGGYLAGAFDGEGCFHQSHTSNPITGVRNNLTFHQNSGAMLDRVKRLLTERGFDLLHDRLPPKKGKNRNRTAEHSVLKFRDRQDILRFLGTFRPVRLLNKLNLDLLGSIPTGRKYATRLVKKEFLGLREVVAIETSTHTFIAEGLASHNCQKVPLNLERDNVTPSYLRELRASVLKNAYTKMPEEALRGSWATDAMSHWSSTKESVDAVLDSRFSKNRASADPSDREAENRMKAKGATIVHGGSLPAEAWERVRELDLMKPAGQLAPSPKPFSENAPVVKTIKFEELATSTQRGVLRYHALAMHLLGFEITIHVANEPQWPYAAVWQKGKRTMYLNWGKLGNEHFVSEYAIYKLALHEFAHEFDGEGGHLSEEYHDALCDLGAKLAVGLNGIELTFDSLVQARRAS
jgi:hypothetical protein